MYDFLRVATVEHDIAVHAHVLMGNHVHRLLTPPNRAALSRATRNFAQYYVQAFNKRRRRGGTLWQGRFKSSPVDAERYRLAVYRYIEINPVRASMVSFPKHYRCSSVRANPGLLDDPLVTPHPAFLAQDIDP